MNDPYKPLDSDMEPLTSRDVKIPHCPRAASGFKLDKRQVKIRRRIYRKVRGWQKWRLHKNAAW